MDSSLIHLIPNLAAANRSNTTSRLHDTRNPTDQPPAYSPDRHFPQTSDKPANKNESKLDIPLTVELLDGTSQSASRPSLYVHNQAIPLWVDTDYWEFLSHVRPILARLGFDYHWEVAILAEVRGRAVWRFRRRDLEIVEEGDWGDALVELGEGRVRGFKVVCFRK